MELDPEARRNRPGQPRPEAGLLEPLRRHPARGGHPRGHVDRHVHGRPRRALHRLHRSPCLPGAAGRWLPEIYSLKKIGAFGLTEPLGGSDVAGGTRTTARRDGDNWILNGAKRWIGNATFSDWVVIYARDVADNQVKGFLVDTTAEGYSADENREQDLAAHGAER